MIRVTGLNHRRAPVELRERFAVPPAALAAELAAARGELGVAEAVLVSTCNRVELYVAGEPADAAPFLAGRRAVPLEELRPVLYVHDGIEAARHLFSVVAGFDSMVPGETQILGQVREAYEAARGAGHTGRGLNKLFQAAMAFAKRMHTETPLAERSLSVSSVAARLAGKVFAGFEERTLLVAGAGETARRTVEAFRARGVKRLLVVNRTLEKAQALGGEAFGLDRLGAVLPRADLVVSCLSHEGYAIGCDDVRSALRARRQEPMFLLDLAVPRNIDPDVNRIDNVYLFDIDDLEEIVRQNLADREREIEAFRPSLDRAVREAMSSIEGLDVQRVLSEMRELCRRIGDEEAGRTLAKLQSLDAATRNEVAHLVERVINRILHAPTTAIREEAKNGETAALVELVTRLFGLGKSPGP